MSIDHLVRAGKYIDEQILRQYTRLTKRWEDKGRSRYTLSNLMNIPSIALTAFPELTGFAEPPPYDKIIGVFQGMNLASDNVLKPYGSDFNVQERSSRVENEIPISPIIREVDRQTRLPLFIAGVGLTGLGLYEIVNGFWNGDNQTLSEGLTTISNGLPFIGVASSQYVKDANPKLLDKEPLYETALNWLKDRASELVPQPALQPIPVRA